MAAEYRDEDTGAHIKRMSHYSAAIARRMVDLFRKKYWLSEPETREYFTVLVEFVELWDRYLSGTHSAKVLEMSDGKDDQLLPFYEES